MLGLPALQAREGMVPSSESIDPNPLNPDFHPSDKDMEFSARSHPEEKNEAKAEKSPSLQLANANGRGPNDKNSKKLAATSAPSANLSLANAETGKATSPESLDSEGLNPDFQPLQHDMDFSNRSQSAEQFTFKDLPRELAGDLRSSFFGWGALGFGLGIGLTAGLHPLDDNLQNSFQKNALFGNTGNDIISWTLSPYTIGGASIITWAVGHGLHNPKLALTGRALTEALFLSMSLDTIAKFSFRRQRPDGGNFGFPSGHATAAFTAAGVLTTFYGWKAGIPSYALASLVSISRVDSYKHFLSDVVMGAVLGSTIGIGTARFFRKENPKYFISPQVSRESASIGFTYIH